LYFSENFLNQREDHMKPISPIMDMESNLFMKYLHSILRLMLISHLHCLNIDLQQKCKLECCIFYDFYLFLFEYCFKMSLIFLAWVRDPPGEEIVTNSPSGLTQNDFLSPVTMESVLKDKLIRLQFLVNISFNSNS